MKKDRSNSGMKEKKKTEAESEKKVVEPQAEEKGTSKVNEGASVTKEEELVTALTAENEALLAENEATKKLLDEANAKIDAYIGKLAGLKGDYERLKTRSSASIESAKAEGKAMAIEKLLPVLDTFDRAKSQVSDEITINALDLILKQFEKLLGDVGITEIEVLGEDFDPNTANAVIKQPVEEEEKKGKVICVVSKGFKHGEKILRYPQVVVGV